MATVRKRTWNKGTPKEKTAWIADYFDQNGDRHIKTFPRQAAAKAWLAETTIQVKQGTHTAERQSITVAEAAELWFENRRAAKTCDQQQSGVQCRSRSMAAAMPTKTARRLVLFPEVPSRWSMRPLKAANASGSRHGRLRAGRRGNRQSLLGHCR